MKTFEETLKIKTKDVEDIIFKYLPKADGHQKTVIDAMNYSVEAGGKRLRPILMYETYKMFHGEDDIVEPFMAAIEFIHTYSLVHDDLPAMDNDEFRRGKKTTHAAFGEAIGILAGDGLLNYGFETAASVFYKYPGSVKAEKALIYLGEKAGIYGMVGGQTVDVETDALGEISKDKLNFVYDLKTGALLMASMHIGALLANASEEELNTIDQIARNIGLSFQIQDDILDVISTTEVLGKPVGSDSKNNKATYVTYEGLDKAKEDVKDLTDKAVNMFDSLNVKNDFLRELLIYLCNRKY